MFLRVKNQWGITLLELLLVMGILSIIMVAMFQVLDLNYATMKEALKEQEVRDDLRIFNAHVIQDLANATFVDVQNEASFDVLAYTDYQGNLHVIKFVHAEGVYEMEDGEEKLLTKGTLFHTDKPMVYEKSGLIYFNVYAKDVNVLLEFAIEPRLKE